MNFNCVYYVCYCDGRTYIGTYMYIYIIHKIDIVTYISATDTSSCKHIIVILIIPVRKSSIL